MYHHWTASRALKTNQTAERFKDFFVSIGTSEKSYLPAKPLHGIPSKSFSMFVFLCEIVEIENIIDNLENKLSSAVDQINNIFLKVTKDSISPYICHLVNQSLKNGAFPEVLKLAKVIPKHKGDSKTDKNNYRPISLIPVWSEVFERVMYNRLYSFLRKCQLLYIKQFGFRPKYCTMDALAEITEKTRSSPGKSSIGSLFLDL